MYSTNAVVIILMIVEIMNPTLYQVIFWYSTPSSRFTIHGICNDNDTFDIGKTRNSTVNEGENTHKVSKHETWNSVTWTVAVENFVAA